MRLPGAARAAGLGALLLLLPAACLAGEAATPGEEAGFEDDGDAEAATYQELIAAPPPLPGTHDAAALHAALPPAMRATVDGDLRVVTFAHASSPAKGRTELVGISVGTLMHPPESVRAVLLALNAYPDWLGLHPSYKTVRVEGQSRLVAGVGSAGAPKAKRQMIYTVEPADAGVRWTVVDSGTQLEPGSLVELTVAPHPVLAGASLVVHRQVGLVPPGRMLKYLSSIDKKGRNRWWADCNRHARRLHWAIDAVLSESAPAERRGVYIGHFQREFHGEVPYWAAR